MTGKLHVVEDVTYNGVVICKVCGRNITNEPSASTCPGKRQHVREYESHGRVCRCKVCGRDITGEAFPSTCPGEVEDVIQGDSDPHIRRRQFLSPGGDHMVQRFDYVSILDGGSWQTGMPVPGFELPVDTEWAKAEVAGVAFKDEVVVVHFHITVLREFGTQFKGWR
jgi:hypothetical protein